MNIERLLSTAAGTKLDSCFWALSTSEQIAVAVICDRPEYLGTVFEV